MTDRALKIQISVAVVGPLLGLILAIILLWNRYVFWTDIALLVVMYAITAIGVTIGFHRMLTHDGFQSSKLLRGIFVVLGCMAVPGMSPLSWVATHIKHHAHSDEEGDPHSPLEGIGHAHLGWLFHKESYADPKVYAPQLLQDPVTMFVDKTLPVWAVLSFLIPFLLGGWTGLLWGGVVRFFFTTHIMWSVNSVCHTFGRRAFETTDESRNEWIVGLLAFGEGWHNNHHAFPQSAFHGLRWWQFDLSGLMIGAMEKLGLIWNVQRVSEETMDAHRVRSVTLASSLAALRDQVMEHLNSATHELESLFSSVVTRTLAPEEYSRVERLHRDAIARLTEIRSRLSIASHMKKQSLQRYLKEVQETVERVKSAVRGPVPVVIEA
jgi:stearoyl-CoA desaturase (delta-9 desaturase)